MGDVRRCLLFLRDGEDGVGCPAAVTGRSLRAGALRFLVEAEPAAGVAIEELVPEGGGSAASLAAERVTLGDMSS